MNQTSKTLLEIYNPTMHAEPAWQFVSDQVMGGVSQGQVTFESNQESPCHCLSGLVSLENNGGFLQMQLTNLNQLGINFSDYQGVYLEVKGNNRAYNLHIRTSQLWLPWQSFRVTFDVAEQWQRLFIPFSQFSPYKTLVSLQPNKIKRLGILAIGEAFQANICIRTLGVYK
ncbi:MAG: CIA30 family protein [Pseudomonadota bacterium]|nr:CIA30 family protein [Pseudomonadota bacterium]